MNETTYHQLVDALMIRLEENLDQAESDLDYVNNSGLLTITCESGVQLVLSRQAPLQQLWLASPKGGLRFLYAPNTSTWVLEKDPQVSLGSQLTRLLQTFAQESFNLDI